MKLITIGIQTTEYRRTCRLMSKLTPMIKTESFRVTGSSALSLLGQKLKKLQLVCFSLPVAQLFSWFNLLFSFINSLPNCCYITCSCHQSASLSQRLNHWFHFFSLILSFVLLLWPWYGDKQISLGFAGVWISKKIGLWICLCEFFQLRPALGVGSWWWLMTSFNDHIMWLAFVTGLQQQSLEIVMESGQDLHPNPQETK